MFHKNAIGFFASAVAPFSPSDLPGLNLLTTSRSGYELVDSLGGTNPTIMPSFFTKPLGTIYGYIADNGALDILDTNFTYCGWVRATSAVKTQLKYLFGKSNFTSAPGSYTVCVNNTTGFIRAYVNSSTGIKSITSDVDFTSGAWFFVLVEVDQANKIMRLFINNVQNQNDLSYTGTFPAMSNSYKFEIGAGQNGTNQYTSGYSGASFSDIRIYKRLLTPTEKTSLYNRGIVDTALAHYPCNNWVLHDCGAGGYHLTTVGITSAHMDYGSNGSRHCLDKGYTVYKATDVADLHIPYTDAGVPIASPIIPAGYYKDTVNPEHTGNLAAHNLANSYVVFSGANWDRSDVTIYSAEARAATTKYIAATPKAWHISELNYSTIHFFANENYKGLFFPKITNDSTYDRQVLTEIIGYDANKTGVDRKNILTYTGDIDGYCEIDYYFETNHICTQRGDKVLAFDDVTKVMSLSLDGGSTFGITLNLNGVCTIITRSRIYPNGNISWATHTKCYYSDDNLATYHESAVTGIDGNPFVPTTYTNFRTLCEIENSVHDDVIDVFNTYSTELDTQTVNINVWYSADSGVTIKSAYKFGVSAPALSVGHGHSAAYNPANGKFMIYTGDTTGEIHALEMTYNSGTGSWTWTNPVDGVAGTRTQGIGFFFIDDYAYFVSEFHGIWRVKYADLADATKYERVTYNDTFASYFYDAVSNIIGTPHTGLQTVTISRDNAKTFYRHPLTGGPDLFADWGGYYVIHPANSAGYHKVEIFATGEDYPRWTAGTVLMLKIKTL
jgi:hypothetical protein